MVANKQSAIARMESGQVSEVSLDFLCKIALALDVPVTIRSRFKMRTSNRSTHVSGKSA
jgi:transcriptional regulator with XRE-family HTH domain